MDPEILLDNCPWADNETIHTACDEVERGIKWETSSTKADEQQ
jgi:hypothetical protein